MSISDIQLVDFVVLLHELLDPNGSADSAATRGPLRPAAIASRDANVEHRRPRRGGGRAAGRPAVAVAGVHHRPTEQPIRRRQIFPLHHHSIFVSETMRPPRKIGPKRNFLNFCRIFVCVCSYPFYPPVVRFLTKIIHPNVSRHGDVGIDIIQHNWSYALSIYKVLLSVQSLLTDPFTQVSVERK